jgi:anionic cell wall polymer biosynthesis LytR-Cps2A-Psr (LCP) family protein
VNKHKSSLLIALLVCLLFSFNTINVQAKISSSFKSSSSSSSTKSSSSSTSSKSAEGFKSGSFSSTSSASNKSSSYTSSKPAPSKSTVTSGAVNKNVNTDSPALKSIPKDYSSHSTNNYYYFNNYNSYSHHSYWDDYWSHYYFYRAMHPEYRVYYVDNDDGPQVAPAYTGWHSAIWDVLSCLLLLGLISWCIYYFWWRKK